MHKIIFFRRISSWFYSVPRNNQRLSVFQSLRLSRLVRSIRIGAWAVLLCSFIFLPYFSPLPESKVTAQEPTATYQPLFPTSTPVPTQNYDCPEGQQPQGWGTVTPDASWYINCSQCVTPIVETGTPYPQSTFTVGMTQTAQAVTTVTPTATLTPVVTATATSTGCGESIICNGVTGGSGTCTQLDACTLLFDLSWSDNSHPYNTAFGNLVAADGLLNSGTPVYVFYDDFTLTVSNYQTSDRYIDFWRSLSLGWNHTQVLNDYLIPAMGTVNIAVPELAFPFTSTTTHQNGFGVGGYGARWATVSVSMNLSTLSMPITVSTRPIQMTPAPTPVVTATPSGYCASVLPAVGSEDPCENGVFCMPDVRIGSKICPVNLSSVTVPLSLLGFNDVTIPSLRICFQEIQFGSMVVWGQDIDIDYIVFVMAGAAIVRMITRS